MSHVLEMLNERDILCNNIVFPWEFNPHNVRLWVIGTQVGGPVAAVWASHEQEALDVFVDANYETFLVNNYVDDESDTVTFAGNASEPQDLSDAHIECVTLDPSDKDDLPWIIKFAEQRGACADNLNGDDAAADRHRRLRNDCTKKVVASLSHAAAMIDEFIETIDNALDGDHPHREEAVECVNGVRSTLTEIWKLGV